MHWTPRFFVFFKSGKSWRGSRKLWCMSSQYRCNIKKNISGSSHDQNVGLLPIARVPVGTTWNNDLGHYDMMWVCGVNQRPRVWSMRPFPRCQTQESLVRDDVFSFAQTCGIMCGFFSRLRPLADYVCARTFLYLCPVLKPSQMQDSRAQTNWARTNAGLTRTNGQSAPDSAVSTQNYAPDSWPHTPNTGERILGRQIDTWRSMDQSGAEHVDSQEGSSSRGTLMQCGSEVFNPFPISPLNWRLFLWQDQKRKFLCFHNKVMW